ncbi:transmembrane protein 272-like [Hypomesus transpacificus]|uniref:transmembrane protein 272-like n=1 Tax=Hypomesus transpacificus TaxID=137520 RepID=UPI001F084F6C|nr:transmembrane protein 272-like [Hypomesus transpacificus]
MEDRTLLQNMRQTPTLSTPALVVSKLVMTILPIAQIAIGGIYLNNCPQERYIPIYLLVSGAFASALAVLSCLPCSKESEEGGQSPLSSFCAAWNSLVSLFLFCWFIAGNVWIYSIYPANYDATKPPYCDKTLYMFAFWTTTLVYIFIGALFVGGCCVLIVMCLCGRDGPSTDDV